MIATSTRFVRRLPMTLVNRQSPQRRSFLDWMTNYPDRIVELKKEYQKGGRSVPTWLKNPSDKYVNAFGAVLFTWGLIQLVPGYYHLASGTGKKD